MTTIPVVSQIALAAMTLAADQRNGCTPTAGQEQSPVLTVLSLDNFQSRA